MIKNEVFNFLSGYFHEDWILDHDSDMDVVRAFAESGINVREVVALADKIECVAAIHDHEFDDSWLLREYGCYYQPRADDLVASDWLRHIAIILRQCVHGRTDFE